MRVRMVCQRGGVVARRKAILQDVDVEATRRSATRAAPTKDARCPFRVNARYCKADGHWHVTTWTLIHNHEPNPDLVMDYINRAKDLTGEHKQFISRLSNCGLEPRDIVMAFMKFFEGGPVLQPQDIRNFVRDRTMQGGNADAHNLLQLIRKKQAEDHRWFVEAIQDAVGRLTHVFWMSLEQRQRVVDVGQVKPTFVPFA